MVEITHEIRPDRDLFDGKELPESGRLGIRVIPERPFCFAKPAIGDNNHFATETHIPGGALIAAINRRISSRPGRWTVLEKNLNQLYFTHALPVQENADKRPVTIPLSLVKTGKKYPDIASNPAPGPIGGEAPLFCIDWKAEEWETPERRYNPPIDPKKKSTPDKLLEIRTAIDEITGTARESSLFSMETVNPLGFHWLANLDLGAIESSDARKQLVLELTDLLRQPLTHLGKTKSSARCELDDEFPYTAGEGEGPTGEVIVYLQTPARLLPGEFQTEGTNQGKRLEKAYRAAWNELSGGTLELVRFYAHQHLLGGSYWWNRFRKPYVEEGTPYRPEIFTGAGSVFVLKVIDSEKAEDKIRKWRRRGLPQLDDAPGGEEWDQNPWIAANGYGEIAINLLPAEANEESDHD